MSKKQIYYVLLTVAIFLALFGASVELFNLPSEFSTIFLMISMAILILNLAFFRFW